MGILQLLTWKPELRILYQYRLFYNDFKREPISFYGLLPLREKGKSSYHKKNYNKTVNKDFQFLRGCQWSTVRDAFIEDELKDSVQYGNIIIAEEGCGIYWLLVTKGESRGEVWLLSDFGITPVAEKLTLKQWKDWQLVSNNTFWHKVIEDWGSQPDDFFTSHMARQMVNQGQHILFLPDKLCEKCTEYISLKAVDQQSKIYVCDPDTITVFHCSGEIERSKFI